MQGSASVWNILYATTDSQYKPSWAVTTFYVPSKPNGTALLSYQVPYDSADLDDSPSYSVYSGSISDLRIWGPILGQGWFLNVPDYEGPLASFTAGVQSGHATIDSVRAVLLRSKFGIADDASVCYVGILGRCARQRVGIRSCRCSTHPS